MNLLTNSVYSQINIVINTVASLILIYTAISFLLEVKKTKATFHLDKNYLKRLLIGFLFIFINSVLGFASDLINSSSSDMFFKGVFILIAILGLILTGTYFSIFKFKNLNIKSAEVEGVSEMEYWERLSNSVSNNLENQTLIDEGS